MPKSKIPLDRLGDEIRDLHGVEAQSARLLGRMARAASEMVLRAMFIEQIDVVRVQLIRLEQIADSLGAACQGGGLSAMVRGMMGEIADVLNTGPGGSRKDSDLIQMMRRVETYKIAGYGIARSLSQMLDLRETIELLQATLDEKLEFSEKLANLPGYIKPGAKAGRMSRAPAPMLLV
jgi:ferritin-like metal-binding protein YciE